MLRYLYIHIISFVRPDAVILAPSDGVKLPLVHAAALSGGESVMAKESYIDHHVRGVRVQSLEITRRAENKNMRTSYLKKETDPTLLPIPFPSAEHMNMSG